MGVGYWEGEERKTVGRVPRYFLKCPPFFRLSDSFMYSVFSERKKKLFYLEF